MNVHVTQCTLLLFLIALVDSMEKTQMYMKRSEVNDQSMSGSGYSYNIHDGGPSEDFTFETGDEDKALKILRDLGYEFDHASEASRYATEPIPLPYEQYYKDFSHVDDKEPLGFNLNQENYQIPDTKVFSRLYSPLDQYEKITYPPKYPYAHGYGHDSHDAGNFLTKNGKSYSDSNFAKHGEKGDTGYQNIDAFDKALKGSYDKEDAKSYYNQNGGSKQSHHDNAGNYAANTAAGKVSFGESFGQAKGHNKGSKTTGYYKVYHKDDYNKQHKFYDKADKSGHFNKYGNHDEKKGSGNGYFLKGGSANQGYNKKKYGVKGLSDHGRNEEVNKGFKGAEGNEGFYSNYAGFSKDGSGEAESASGYKV